MEDKQLRMFEDRINRAISFIEELKAKEKVLADEKADIEQKVEELQEQILERDKKIEELLLEFQSKKSYAAIVTDEYGGTSGLVTVEDILEEIVGEIQDEYDTEERLIFRIDEQAVSVSGKTSLHDLNEELHTHFKAKDAQTVGGFLIHLFGRIPKSGESARYRSYIFTADDVRKHRIRKITIRKK